MSPPRGRFPSGDNVAGLALEDKEEELHGGEMYIALVKEQRLTLKGPLRTGIKCFPEEHRDDVAKSLLRFIC